MAFYFPLFGFRMGREDYQIARDLIIKRTPYDFEKAKVLSNISEYHRLALKRTEFWAVATDQNLSDKDASIVINTFLLALWTAGPVRVTTFFKIMDYRTASIFHDQFHHNTKDTFLDCTDALLERTSSFYADLLRIYKRNGRLQTAMVNTYFGCVTVQWKVAFICFSAALETILSYHRGPGVTRRLAKSYACLTELKKRNRDKVYREFIRLYGIRSRIVHGENRLLRDPDRNLSLLSTFSALLRNLWQVTLLTKGYCRELEHGDKKREGFFKQIEAGYQAPRMRIT
jgi:hypothetical protein